MPPTTTFACAVAVLALGCGGSDPVTTGGATLRGTAYEIFLRSFADSDGDGIGDLKGLTARLDYLNDGDASTSSDLGVSAIWLTPIFPSPSYHGYDVTDYRGINPAYGTLADFDAFLAAAHQRHIKVILDFVLNHSSDHHSWFLDSATGDTSAKRDWYMWRAAAPTGWKRPWDGGNPWTSRGGAFYYSLFCGCMPDLNLGNPAVVAELTESMKFWLARGVDGFRLDAVRYFFESAEGNVSDQPETHTFLRKLRADLDRVAPGMVLVSESASSLEIQATYYGDGDESNQAFSFEIADALKTSARAGSADALIRVLDRTQFTFMGIDRSFEAPFLANHDQPRVMRAIGDAAAARVAAAALFAMPGTPFVYYGEELGMQGGSGNADQNKRTPFHWTGVAPGFGFTSGTPWYPTDEAEGVDVASQQTSPTSLWSLYRTLITQRSAHAALDTGDTSRPATSGGGAGVVTVLRTAPGGGRVLFIGNFAATATGPFTVDVSGAPDNLLAEGLDGSVDEQAGKLAIRDLAARGFAYIALP